MPPVPPNRGGTGTGQRTKPKAKDPPPNRFGTGTGQGNAAGSAAPAIKGAPDSPCLISYPSTGIPLVGTVGGGCLFSKTNGRAFLGAFDIGLGVLMAIVGVGVLAAAGFRHSGTLQTIQRATSFVPGVGGAVARVAKL